jgi:hypothetical protein
MQVDGATRFLPSKLHYCGQPRGVTSSINIAIGDEKKDLGVAELSRDEGKKVQRSWICSMKIIEQNENRQFQTYSLQ